MKRVYGEDDPTPTVSEQMERDQRSAERINAWINRFSENKKSG